MAHLGCVKRIWYLSPMRAAKVQASLRIRTVLPEPPLLAHTSSESRGTFRQKARSLALLNGWACAVKICHSGMLEDTNSLDGAHFKFSFTEPHYEKTCFMLYANNKDAACAFCKCSLIRAFHSRGLINAFIVHCLGRRIPILAKSKISRL